MHCHWVLEDLSGERMLGEFRVRFRTMSEDGGEVPACGCTADEETFGKVRVEATGVLLSLVVTVRDSARAVMLGKPTHFRAVYESFRPVGNRYSGASLRMLSTRDRPTIRSHELTCSRRVQSRAEA